jgi:hypothetical protein
MGASCYLRTLGGAMPEPFETNLTVANGVGILGAGGEIHEDRPWLSSSRTSMPGCASAAIVRAPRVVGRLKTGDIRPRSRRVVAATASSESLSGGPLPVA